MTQRQIAPRPLGGYYWTTDDPPPVYTATVQVVMPFAPTQSVVSQPVRVRFVRQDEPESPLGLVIFLCIFLASFPAMFLFCETNFPAWLGGRVASLWRQLKELTF